MANLKILCIYRYLFKDFRIWNLNIYNFVTFFIISRPLYLLSFHKTSLYYVCNFPRYTYFWECTYSNLEAILKTFYFSRRLSLHYLVIWTKMLQEWNLSSKAILYLALFSTTTSINFVCFVSTTFSMTLFT